MPIRLVVVMVVVIVIVIVIAPLAIWFLYPRQSVRFQDAVLDTNAKTLAILASRHTLDVNTTSQAGLLGNVGLIIVVDHSTSSSQPMIFDRRNTDGEFRPSPDMLIVQPLNNVLYEGKVSKNLSESGSYTSFTTDLALNQAADVIVKDEIYFGYKDRTQIPYKALRRYRMDPKKSYFFVESATLTSIAHKVYEETTLKSALSGTAFGANGKIFVSNSGYIYNAMLGVDLVDLSLLQPEEGGSNPEVTRLLRKDILTDSESGQLLTFLKEGSRNSAQAALGIKSSIKSP